MLESSNSLTRKIKLETSWKSLLVINHVILNMLQSLLLASRIDVLFKRMYLKKMTALFDFSFLKTGNLSSPPDDEHSSALADAWSGSSILWMRLKGSRISWAFRKGVGGRKTSCSWVSRTSWVLGGFEKVVCALCVPVVVCKMKRLHKISVFVSLGCYIKLP